MTAQRISRRKWGLLAGAGVLAATYPTLIERHWISLNHYEVPLPHLPPAFEGYRIAQITDTHLGDFVSPDFLRQAVQLTNDAGADLIVATGDYVRRSEREVRGVWPILRGLRARDGVAAVLGNHDHWASTDESLRQLEATGFSVRHRIKPIVRRGQRLLIGGAGDRLTDDFGIDPILARARPEDCRVVLAHNPDDADRTNMSRIDLMLSGHTHGGQVHLPGLGAPLLPVENKSYDSGAKRPGNKTLFISRGVGWSVAPVRLGCPPEIAVLTLVPAS